MQGKRKNQIALESPVEKKEAKRDAFPAPTREPVDLAKMHRALDFNPKHGPGDVEIFIGFGLTMRKVKNKAESMARKLLPDFRGHADDQDAVRHALASFLLTRKVGDKNAKIILDGHERFPFSPGSGLGLGSGSGNSSHGPGPSGDVLQDLYNNRVGRQAALDPRNKGKAPDQVIMELYRAGKLQTRPFRIKGQEFKKDLQE